MLNTIMSLTLKLKYSFYEYSFSRDPVCAITYFNDVLSKPCVTALAAVWIYFSYQMDFSKANPPMLYTDVGHQACIYETLHVLTIVVWVRT